MDNDFRGIFAQNRGSKRHGNADGILRFCHGTGFICDELKSFERKNNVRKGIILEETEHKVHAAVT